MKIIKKKMNPVKLTWTPSAQLIQGVVTHFGISKQEATKQLHSMAEVATRMNLDFTKIPDAKILQTMMATNNVLSRKNPKMINNNRK